MTGEFLGLGLVVTVSPLTVRRNGDTAATPAAALDDMTGATTSTEVLLWAVEGRRFAARVR